DGSPAAVSVAWTRSPIGSSPSRVRSRTSAPSRRAATAWLAPFPPADRPICPPETVSPGRGSRGTATVKSRLLLPITTTRGIGGASPWIGRTVRRSGRRADQASRERLGDQPVEAKGEGRLLLFHQGQLGPAQLHAAESGAGDDGGGARLVHQQGDLAER